MNIKNQQGSDRSIGTQHPRIGLSLAVLMATLSYGGPSGAEDAADIQKKIEEQRAENEQLKAKIAKLEQVLKTDVCSNPEAAKLLETNDANAVPKPAETGR